jgi:hypothetical protein
MTQLSWSPATSAVFPNDPGALEARVAADLVYFAHLMFSPADAFVARVRIGDPWHEVILSPGMLLDTRAEAQEMCQEHFNHFEGAPRPPDDIDQQGELAANFMTRVGHRLKDLTERVEKLETK